MNPAPDFSPGAGWHRDGEGFRIPGCPQDLADRRVRAWRGYVLRLRAGGERFAAVQLRNMEPIAGGVLLMPGADVDWRAHLFDLPNVTQALLQLDDAQLVRAGADFRQYVGLERVGRDRWPQTWICTRRLERMAEVLARMADRER